MAKPNPSITSVLDTATLPPVRQKASRPTGRLVRVTRTTRMSSERLGNCEICDKHMTEAFKSHLGREIERADGSVYIEQSNGGVYAHESCIAKLAEND